MDKDPEIRIARHLCGENSLEEEQDFKAWLASSEDNKRLFEQYAETWMLYGVHGKKESFSQNESWRQIESRLGFNRPQARLLQPYRRLYRLAAAALIITSLATFSYWLINHSPSGMPEMISLNSGDSLRSILLADGSEVWMNRHSSLRYPKEFDSGKREVFLEGEAFFQVSPDAAKPFLINTGNALVQVVGTSFNVRAYPAQANTLVTVATGLVKLSMHQQEANALFLKPGECGLASENQKTLRKEQLADVNYLAWKDHRFSFQETRLTQVAEALERVYAIKIRITDSSLQNLRLTGKFDEKMTAPEILETIAINFGLKLKQDNPDEFSLVKP